MAETRTAKLRRLWLNVHLWLGVGLALLLIPISVSGGLLVFHDEIDAIFNPKRYAVSGAEVAQPASAYLARATEALASEPGNFAATGLRYPDEPGAPVRVMARPQQRGDGPPRFFTVFLDPPTAQVLDVMDFRSSFFGFMHVFHENLTLPQYSGRQIVGWVGVAMLILSLTGIWLWWPRNGRFLIGLRWTRSPRFTFNLHNMLGFWISIPLAVVSLTGIYLSFPQTARNMMSSIATMTPPGARPGFGNVMTHTNLTADRALEIARQTEPSATPVAIFLPTMAGGPGGRGPQANATQQGERPRQEGGRGPAPSWRIQLARSETETMTVSVDDRAGSAVVAPARASGDQAASWIRWIHEGSHSGPVWKVIVLLTGIFPTIFAVTGVIMWLRRRASRKALDAKRGVQLSPAE
ncbi:PepSY domain-containing protein [Pseudolabrys taiwanensis]|uniref:PepSY domain-containing protein n=1 Tax=Pseudolabrys taiwanensis TaxID=331696 RepID=A0A346A3G0_9HYPH|nr:PepSY-associated TM helix domain-containing protein [Pseudolabrys taiwanensis]AXK83707.1 PepSY domain-containing protein [Pseudolabrys taiwanensis]